MKSDYYSWKDLTEKDKNMAADVIEGELVKLSPIGTALSPGLEKTFPVKAVLFDIYGTLLISGTGDISLSRERDNFFSLKKALDISGITLNMINADSVLAARITREIKAAHDVLHKQGEMFPEVDIISIWHRVLSDLDKEVHLDGEITTESLAVISAYNEIVSNPVWEMPGAFTILEYLKNKGFPLGIISNAQYYTPLTLERLAGLTLEELGFTEDLCSWSYRLLKGKPSADLFRGPLEFLKSRNIEPEEVLYVGNDMLNDIYTAGQWGCKTALFAGDQRSLRLREEDDRCSDLSPDLIITDLIQLKEIL